MKLKQLFILLLLPFCCNAQAVNTAPAYKNIAVGGYARVSYENDFFTASDRYYTQGLDIEVVSPAFRRLITNKLLYTPPFSYTRYGVGIQHNGYTPNSVSENSILYGDRPYAGVTLLKTFALAIDTVNRQRFYTSVNAGVIGSAAFAGDIQMSVHKFLGNYAPHGWLHQIRNDVAINYNAAYEKEVLRAGRFLSVSGGANVNLGSLNCGVGVDGTIMVGYFLSPFTDERRRKGMPQLFIYEHPGIYLPGYDATLQGGVFNRYSPYVVTETHVVRPVLRNRYGFVLAWRSVYLEYFVATLSKEFSTGESHRFGGVQFVVGF